MIHTIASLLLRSKIVDSHYFWMGTKNASTGHGFVRHNGKQVYVHRLAFCLENNLDYKGDFLVCHSTDCNEPACWRPEHLYKGTYSSNMKDQVTTKVHKNSQKTHCPEGHEYTPSNTRIDYNSKGRQLRRCRTCLKKQFKKYHINRKQQNA